MPGSLLLVLRGLSRGNVHILVAASLEDAVGKGIELLLLLVQLAECEPETNAALCRILVT